MVYSLKLPVTTLSHCYCVYDDTLRRFRTRRPSTLQCDSDYYESIDIEVSISILFRKSIDIGIDDTFKMGIDIEYRIAHKSK